VRKVKVKLGKSVTAQWGKI